MKLIQQISVITILIATAYAQSTRDSRSIFSATDYVFTLDDFEPIENAGGTINPIDLATFPALKDEGTAFTLFNIEPCGINLPHVHPRATELLYVIAGDNITVGFVEENGGRTIINTIGQDQATLFPQGLVHYQQNNGCERATYISALNHEDPGVLKISTRIATLPTEALSATFDISEEEVLSLFSNVPGGPAMGTQACLDRCAAAGNRPPRNRPGRNRN